MELDTAVQKYTEIAGYENVHTIKSTRNALASLLRSGVALNNDILLNYEAWLRRSCYSDGTVRMRLSAARMFLIWLDQSNNLPANMSWASISMQWRRRHRRYKPYSFKTIDPRITELVRYFDVMPMPESLSGQIELLRNRALVAVLFSTAMRESECIGLTRAMVADGHASDTIVRGKGGRERTVYFDRDARRAMMNYCLARRDRLPELWISTRHDVKPLFASGIYQVIKKAARDLGLSANTSPHSIRHWVARDMLLKGVPIEVIQEIMGHANIGTTLIYARTTNARVRRFVLDYQAKKEV